MKIERHRSHIVPFPVDHAIEDCMIARRNFYLGLWAGRALGLADNALLEYACSVVAADYEEPGHEDVIRKLRADFAAAGLATTRDEIVRELCLAQTIAVRQLATSD
jgi:hypothetical protein